MSRPTASIFQMIRWRVDRSLGCGRDLVPQFIYPKRGFETGNTKHAVLISGL